MVPHGDNSTYNFLISASNSFKFLMQPDGNLVVYQTKDMKVMWASNTMNSGAIVAKMQPDGNFVLYNASNLAKWASGTNRHPGAILNLLDKGDHKQKEKDS